MSDGKSWKSTSEQEDWLRTKGKLLAYVIEVLANRLRAAFNTAPQKAKEYVFGYFTPVAAEYVRRVIYQHAVLSNYEKAQLYLFTIRMYDYVISHYGGQLPDAKQCVEELLETPIPLADPAFFRRMRRVTEMFNEYFGPEVQRDKTDEAVFAAVIAGHVMRIVKDQSGTPLAIDEEGCAGIQRYLENTGETIYRLLAD